MIKIMADSTCDLSEEIIERYNIGIAPLNIIIDGKSYKDRINISPNEFYEYLEVMEEHPTTSMPSPDEYIKIFESSKKEGYKEILCICMSSGTSGAYQSAVLAKDYYYSNNESTDIKIHIVDSCSMSLGSGWLIMKAAQLLEEGFTFEELIEFCEEYKKNIKHFLCVDDLDNLIKSGRLSNSSAFIGKILNIKPIMTMKDGKGKIIAKERGLRRVFRYYIEEFENRVDKDQTNFINIGYTDNIKLAEDLKKEIYEKTDFTGEIYIMQKGAAVGTHVGSGGLSMFFLEKGNIVDQNLRDKLKMRIKNLKELIID